MDNKRKYKKEVKFKIIKKHHIKYFKNELMEKAKKINLTIDEK